MTIRLEHVDNLNRTPALLLAMRAHVKLMDDGLSDNVAAVAWDHHAIIAYHENGAAVGVITFSNTNWARQVDIGMGWVAPAYRRQGIYRMMWDRLCEEARKLGAVAVFGNTAMENRGMRETAKALGRKEIAVILRYDL